MSLVTSCDPPLTSSTSSDSEGCEYEHSDAEFAKEISNISVDTDGDDSDELYEVEEKTENSFDLETFVATTSVHNIFSSK